MKSEEITPLAVNKDNFDSAVLSSPKPVLVDFSAVWCQPCRAIAPVLGSLAVDYADELNVAMVDVDNSPELAARYGVRSVPTVMLIANGAIRRVFVGARPAEEYRQGIEALIH